jgi:hypothetical protein
LVDGSIASIMLLDRIYATVFTRLLMNMNLRYYCAPNILLLLSVQSGDISLVRIKHIYVAVRRLFGTDMNIPYCPRCCPLLVWGF